MRSPPNSQDQGDAEVPIEGGPQNKKAVTVAIVCARISDITPPGRCDIRECAMCRSAVWMSRKFTGWGDPVCAQCVCRQVEEGAIIMAARLGDQ